MLTVSPRMALVPNPLPDRLKSRSEKMLLLAMDIRCGSNSHVWNRDALVLFVNGLHFQVVQAPRTLVQMSTPLAAGGP